jgi:DNA-binding IclR family transcriptional regulator
VDGRSIWQVKDVVVDQLAQVVAGIHAEQTQKELAEALLVAKSTVSKLKARAVEQGYLTRVGALTESGKIFLAKNGLLEGSETPVF